MPKTLEPITEAAILERMVAPEKGGFSAAAAKSVLTLRFHRDDTRRMNSLAKKARAGTLSEAEQEILKSYERIGHLVNFLQARARRSLEV